MDTVELPPIPDRDTGEPRPPAAPLQSSGRTSEPGEKRRAPQPPEGEGPIIEYYVSSRRSKLQGALLYAAIAIVFLILKDWGFAWMIEMRSLWIAVVLMGGLGYLAASSFEMSAGSDWYREHDNYVKIYELTTVEVTKRVGSWGLKLVDKNGRSVEPGLTAAQLNPKLWDLVYNGILHSVCDGAEVNYRAVKMLQLERIGQ